MRSGSDRRGPRTACGALSGAARRRSLCARTLLAGALVLSWGLPACESDACHEEEVTLFDDTLLPASARPAFEARCTHGDAADRCPIEDCRARCPLYSVGGSSTVSVEPKACRVVSAEGRLSCDYRVIYDICEG